MAKEAHEHQSPTEYMGPATWRVILEATKTLAEAQGMDYTVADAPFEDDEGLLTMQTRKLGTYSRYGDLENGLTKFIRFDKEAKEIITQHTGEDESLVGQIEFAKQRSNAYFYGSMRLYEYPAQEGEVRIDVRAQAAEADIDTGFEFFGFASRLGLGNVWDEVYEAAGDPFEQHYTGLANRKLGQSIAFSLRNLAANPG
jgi:hypothetical protein